MDRPIEYKPWTSIDDLDVPVSGLYGLDGERITHLRVPRVYARDASAVVGTAIVIAGKALEVLRRDWPQPGL